MGSKKDQEAIVLTLERLPHELVVIAAGEVSDKQLDRIVRRSFDLEEPSRGVVVIDEGPPGGGSAAAAKKYRLIGHIWLPKRLRSKYLWLCTDIANANHYGALLAAALE